MLLATTREKPRRAASARGVDGVARARDRAAAQRERVGFVGRRRQPGVVAPQRGRVRQEEVRDQHGLGAAQVRIRRHQRVAGRLGPIGAGGDERGHRALQQRNPASADTAADRATPARCATGRCAAGGRRRRCARPAAARRSCARPRRARPRTPGRAAPARGSRCSAPSIAATSSLDSTPALPERLGPGQAAGHVVLEERPIEAERDAEVERGGIGSRVEAARPQGHERFTIGVESSVGRAGRRTASVGQTGPAA